MSGTLPWYVARASGLVAWALLAGSVVWGLLMTSKVMRRRVKNSWLLDLHRWLGGLALVFTGVHVAAILADTYVHFGLASVLVPLATTWHPVAVAWGVASLYLLAAVEVTSLLRKHLSHRLWKRVHFLSFPLFVSSTIHGLSAGTDGRTPMAVITAALVTSAVAALVAVRVRKPPHRPAVSPPLPRPRPAASPAAARRIEPTDAAASRAPVSVG
ncbi:MAG TPA: ferric reductase-like transmembrane domain-containing protein [Acidimicrobiales bacterium]